MVTSLGFVIVWAGFHCVVTSYTSNYSMFSHHSFPPAQGFRFPLSRNWLNVSLSSTNKSKGNIIKCYQPNYIF